MSRARHVPQRAKGGRTEMKVSGNPDVFKEAEEKHGAPVKKHGGKVKRASGGGVEGGKTVGLMTGGAVRPRLDRPGRKRGGGVGADMSPLSTAHKGSTSGHGTPNPRDTYGGTPSD
jgi:hypothetical protein